MSPNQGGYDSPIISCGEVTIEVKNVVMVDLKTQKIIDERNSLIRAMIAMRKDGINVDKYMGITS